MKVILRNNPVLVIACILTLFTLPAHGQVTDAQKMLSDSIEYDKLNIAGVKTALDKGADPNWVSSAPDKKLYSVLGSLAMAAIFARNDKAEEKSVGILQMLFRAGAKLGPSDDGILYFPVARGWVDFTEILLQHGADPTREIDGKTPMEIAIGEGQAKIVKLLKKHGAQESEKGIAAQVSFMEAVRDRDIAKIEAAIRKGANVNKKNRQGEIALIEVVANPDFSSEDYAIVQFLLKKGADPKIQGKWYSEETTALHCAIFCSSTVFGDKGMNDERRNNARLTIESLLSHGALVAARNSNGMTPLHVAAKINNIVGAQMLIDAGSPITLKDNKGMTPLDHAESAEMIKLLKSHAPGKNEKLK